MDNKTKEAMNKLETECSELIWKRDELNKKISEKLVEITRLILLPFKEGQFVKCEVPSGRNKKECLCQIEIDMEGRVWVRPAKADGVLGGRRFRAVPEDGKSYSKIFKEVNE